MSGLSCKRKAGAEAYPRASVPHRQEIARGVPADSPAWTYGRHPPPAQRVAAEEGSQKDGPVTVPLTQRQLSKSGFGLLEWILVGVSRGVLVYGWGRRSVRAGGRPQGEIYPAWGVNPRWGRPQNSKPRRAGIDRRSVPRQSLPAPAGLVDLPPAPAWG